MPLIYLMSTNMNKIIPSLSRFRILETRYNGIEVDTDRQTQLLKRRKKEGSVVFFLKQKNCALITRNMS